MSHPNPTPKRRRQRTVFHYKVDEVLRPEDRENYLALIRCPMMRNEDAHAWLLGRRYRLSLSAVARHRRRLIDGDAKQRVDLRRTEMLAHFLGGPEAPDFAAAAEVQFQYMLFRHLLDIDPTQPNEQSRGADQSPNDTPGGLPGLRPVDAAELTRLIKLLSTSVNLSVARIRRQIAEKSVNPPPAACDDAALRKEIEDILAGRK